MSLLGWMVAAALAVRLREMTRRLELVAGAEHELRGPLGALGLLAAAVARDPAKARLAGALESQLDRARGGLDDLTAARAGRRAAGRPELVSLESAAVGAAAGPLGVDWAAGPVSVRVDRRRIAQVFGNLLSNAAEHGGGHVSMRAHRRADRVLVEIADRGPGFVRPPEPGRGRGLRIAAKAVEEAGGHLRLIQGGKGATVAVELPVADS